MNLTPLQEQEQDQKQEQEWAAILANHKPTAKTYDEALDLAFEMYPEDLVGEELVKQVFNRDSVTNQPYRSPLFKVAESKES